ncbi:MAG: methionine--tRNA ligase [Chloroflexota bacterium]|nr:methionine--tRNA ligase [Chloroflexota bacterium]
MKERILIAVAWPYANGSLHLGHIAGAYLPADIFARYNRLKGNDVLMVSGSDQHGTPITVRADQEGVSPREIAERYHNDFLESWRSLGISFDLFTSTGTENHRRVAQAVFTSLNDKGHIYRDKMSMLYCPNCSRFLPDRYVEGICPHCRGETRGDQCDGCGKPLNPQELINPKCKHCDGIPEVRESEHYFLRLSVFNDKLSHWAGEQAHWKPNVRNFTTRFLNEGLRDRAITRDIEWGVPVPVEGFENKRIYVWFEAVIGYLSASMEWAQVSGDGDAWRRFWDGDARSYYFIGKDNIPFHTIIWPSMLMGYGGLNLPYDVPANEYLTIGGRALSTSRNWAVWVPDYLSRYDPDPLRYFLSVSMPEDGDTDFSWREFVRRNNDELVATYGNLVHRVLTITYKNFEGKVPTPGGPDERSDALIEGARKTFKDVDGMIGLCRFREAMRNIMALAHETNRYLDEKAPWKAIKEDREEAGTSLYVALSVISCLKTMFSPFLPFTSAKLHGLLGLPGSVEELGWAVADIVPGQQLMKPEPLFTKLDESIVVEEDARMESACVN